MADENTPAFYPRVGNIKSKNFVPAKPMPFIEDERAMDLPQYGDVDLSVPSKENLELSRRMAERDAQLRRQREADRSPLEKLAGGVQAGRFLGSALTQAINSAPTRLFKGDEAADKFMQDRMYKPEQPLAYEYAQDVGDFLEKLETEYKIPPLMPEALPLQFLTGPATAQAARAAGKGAVKAGMALEQSMEPVVKGALEQGGLPREMVLAMGANTQSNVIKPKGGNFLGGQTIMTPERGVNMLMTPTVAGETPAQRIPKHEALLNDPTLNQDQRDRVQRMLDVTKGEAALDQWAKSNLLNYVKTDLASPNDPVRQFIDKSYADIEAKYAKDQERAARMAERAALEPDPRRKANLTRQALTMRIDAKSDYDLGMDNISHLPREDLADVDLAYPELLAQRRKEGFPEQGMGVSDPAKRYETLADDAIKVSRAGDLQITSEIEPLIVLANKERNAVTDKINNAYTDFLRGKGMSEEDVISLNKLPLPFKAENLGMAEELQAAQNNLGMMFEQNRSFDANAMRDNPFVAKLDPETKLYSGSTFPLGFDHVMDVLRQDVAAGRIRPEQLNKLSVEQAVRRTQEYNLERAKTMRDAKLIQQEGFTTYKDYPDQGYKWIELAVPEPLLPENYKILPDVTNYKNPGNELYSIFDGNGNVLSTGATEAEAKKLFKRKDREQQLADALKYEGDTMGHCVGGYCPDVISGRSKIYSLRDAKGEPHVTIEVVPNQHLDYNTWFDKQPEEIQNRIAQRRKDDKNHDVYEGPEYLAAREALPLKIKQIKGKQNAKPKDDYLPFVQDFVKGGNWSYIGDFKNTGLIREGDQLMTPAEHADYLLKELGADTYNELGLGAKPPEGMKRGGKVSISNNPDTMMLEVNNQKMKNGVPAYSGAGLIKGGMKAAKPPKIEVPIRFPVSRGPTVPEIRAMAERMAPQVMGEFVRAAPTPSNPKPSTSVTGKTQKQFEREKTLPIEYQNIKEPVTPEEFDYAQKKGALLIGAQGDVTPGNRMLMSIDEQPLSVPVHLQAGPEWELYNPSAWAASDQMAKTYMNRADKAAEAYNADPYLHYHKMTPDANFYAMHHLNSVLGHLRPEELMMRNPKLYQQMVEEIRTRDVGYGKHPEFEGFEDPLNLQVHAQMDPNFRRHLSAIFDGPRFTERYGLNSGQDVMAATSLPELRDLEAGASGYAIVPLDVKAPLKHFEAESQTYDTGFPKAGASGRSKYPSPYQLIYRDTLNWMKDNPSEKKSSEFGRMNMIVPKQQIDNELIEAIGEYQRRMKELTGKKKGGLVKKEGGYIKKPAAYINGDEFVNAAKKYGIKDSMNNLNKIVDLVNKGLSVDDAAQQVADTGMHKAAGGAIRGDDLILEERPL